MEGQHSALMLDNGGRVGMGSKVLGDGKGGYGVDLLLAHDAHGFGAELVGVIDGGDARLGRVESSGLPGAMDAHALAHARRFLDGGFELGLGVLVGRGELTIGEVVGTGLINLDKVCALLELLPYHRDQFAGIVSVGGIGCAVLGGIEGDGISRAPRMLMALPLTLMRGPGISPESMALRTAESAEPAPSVPMSRSAVKPAIRSSRAAISARIVRSGTDSTTVWRSSAPRWRKRWTWTSMSPGIRVAAPRSITVAPPGWATEEPASTMRLPRTSTSPGLTRVPCSTSKMWAAWRTMVPLAGMLVGAAGD